MKYIRTKDGVYERYIKERTIKGYINVYSKGLLDTKGYKIVAEERVIKTADTIEELCDEFVVVRENGKPMTVSLDLAKEYAKCGIETYGAIWTNKGLIYVAKMNEEGELELL